MNSFDVLLSSFGKVQKCEDVLGGKTTTVRHPYSNLLPQAIITEKCDAKS